MTRSHQHNVHKSLYFVGGTAVYAGTMMLEGAAMSLVSKVGMLTLLLLRAYMHHALLILYCIFYKTKYRSTT